MNKHHITLIIICSLALLTFSNCPMEPPPVGGAQEWWLDPRLVGAFRFTFGDSYEEVVIGTASRYGTGAQNDGNQPLGYLVFGNNGWDGGNIYNIFFGGDIVYAKAFRTSNSDNRSAGVIIIKCWQDHPVTWEYWSEAPPGWAAQGYRNPANTYYGLYYVNMRANGGQVFVVQTNEQATNYGPTETRTLEQAIAKFTEGNINNLMNLDVGDPQTRYTGTPGFPGLGALP